MAKLWVLLLATAPSQVFIFWTTGWLVVTTLRERRITRAAAAEARALVRGTSSPTPEPPTQPLMTRLETMAVLPASSSPSQDGTEQGTNLRRMVCLSSPGYSKVPSESRCDSANA